jgi:hypothetical protein
MSSPWSANVWQQFRATIDGMSPPESGTRGVLVVLLLAACQQPRTKSTTIWASSYDRSCERSADCIAVFEGDLSAESCAAMLPCPNAAISVDAGTSYEDAFQSLATQCLPPNIMYCDNGALTCATGQCELRQVPFDAGTGLVLSASDYSHTCNEVADCIPVYLGPLDCCTITCPNATISAAAMDQYQSDLNHRAPMCGPHGPCINHGRPLSCSSDGRIACENGTCVLLFPPTDGGSQ